MYNIYRTCMYYSYSTVHACTRAKMHACTIHSTSTRRACCRVAVAVGGRARDAPRESTAPKRKATGPRRIHPRPLSPDKQSSTRQGSYKSAQHEIWSWCKLRWPCIGPSDTLVIPWERRSRDFSNFQIHIFISPPPSRISTNARRRVGLI